MSKLGFLQAGNPLFGSWLRISLLNTRMRNLARFRGGNEKTLQLYIWYVPSFREMMTPHHIILALVPCVVIH